MTDVTDATNVAAAGGVMNTGDESIGGAKTFRTTIVGSINGNAATATKIASIDNNDIVTKTAPQTLTNKTLTEPTIQKIRTSQSTILTLPQIMDTLVSQDSTDTLTNKTLTSAVLNGTVSGNAIKDENNMLSNSKNHLATQKSIKGYVDGQISTLLGGNVDTALDTIKELADWITDNPAGQNVVLKLAGLDSDKQDILTFNGPDSENGNPSTSAQIKAYVEGKKLYYRFRRCIYIFQFIRYTANSSQYQ